MAGEAKPWRVGQRAVINRSDIVTIDSVTPSGRAMVGKRVFNSDGLERTGGKSHRRAVLELLTPEIEAEAALKIRASAAGRMGVGQVGRAERWLRETFGVWAGRKPGVADVERAENLAVAIASVMGGGRDGQ